MLTIFTIPKAFQGHNGIIQTNAVKSWLTLNPRPEIILLGKDEGTAETAAQLGLKHIADIDCNEYGTPLVSSAFEKAQNAANNQLMCYVNADIILLSNFIEAIKKVRRSSFLIIGQRHDLDITELIDYDNTDWESNLQKLVAERGKLHPPSGIDYFIFNRGLYSHIPPFAVGRTAWDNWLVYQAKKLKATLIDATPSITAVHQNHDYSHHPQGESAVWKGPESLRNRELMGSVDTSFQSEYADLILTPTGTKQALSIRRIYCRIRAIPVVYPRLHFLLSPIKIIEKILGIRPVNT